MPNSGKEALSSITKFLHIAGGSKEQLSEQSTSVEFRDKWTVQQSKKWTVKCTVETWSNGSIDPFERDAVRKVHAALLSKMQALQASIETNFVSHNVAGQKDPYYGQHIARGIIEIARKPVRDKFAAENASTDGHTYCAARAPDVQFTK